MIHSPGPARVHHTTKLYQLINKQISWENGSNVLHRDSSFRSSFFYQRVDPQLYYLKQAIDDADPHCVLAFEIKRTSTTGKHLLHTLTIQKYFS